jgi:hypothetical protein
VRNQLAKQIEAAIRAVLDSDEFRRSVPKPAESTPFHPKEPVDGPGRFRHRGEPIGLVQEFMRSPQKVLLSPEPTCWFRMMPTIDPGRTWSVDEVQRSMQSPKVLAPISSGGAVTISSVHMMVLEFTPCSPMSLM